MSLELNNRRFMNLQEAVAWLLANNALPFQSTANYAPNTEIAKTTIINPSPAEIKVGSLVLFADSKVGTVSGITTNGFMVGSAYTDIKEALAYISNVNVSSSGVLTTTLSDGTVINAGRIKQINNFSINASQHLIANYNDGTSTDLGAIFSGNVNISGTLNATAITGDSIIETMTGFTFDVRAVGLVRVTANVIYAGMVKNGNKLTLVLFASLIRTDDNASLGSAFEFNMPNSVGNKIYPYTVGAYTNLVDLKKTMLIGDTIADLQEATMFMRKTVGAETTISISSRQLDGAMTLNKEYLFRYEATFLLSDSLI